MIFGLIVPGGLFVETALPSGKGHRYPVEIISHCVWLYHRFPLSFREVGELMLGSPPPVRRRGPARPRVSVRSS